MQHAAEWPFGTHKKKHKKAVFSGDRWGPGAVLPFKGELEQISLSSCVGGQLELGVVRTQGTLPGAPARPPGLSVNGRTGSAQSD